MATTDPVLQRTNQGARQLLRWMRRFPAAQQAAKLDQALRRFDPGLPAKVRQLATRFRAQGMSVDQAVEQALTLSIADSVVTHFKQIGIAAAEGNLRPMGGLGVLGSLGTTTPSTSSPDAGQILGQTVQGILCAPGLQAAITDLVGRNQGRDAANATGVGYSVAQGVAQCSQLAPAPPPAPTNSTESDSGSGMLVPVLVGVAAIAAVGGVLWYTSRKKS